MLVMLSFNILLLVPLLRLLLFASFVILGVRIYTMENDLCNSTDVSYAVVCRCSLVKCRGQFSFLKEQKQCFHCLLDFGCMVPYPFLSSSAFERRQILQKIIPVYFLSELLGFPLCILIKCSAVMLQIHVLSFCILLSRFVLKESLQVKWRRFYSPMLSLLFSFHIVKWKDKILLLGLAKSEAWD